MGNRPIEYFVFQDAITTPSQGKEYMVSSVAETMRIVIKGTATVFTINFQGSIQGEWRPIIGAKVSNDLELLTSTSNKDYFYEFDMSGYDRIRMDVVTVTGGDLTILGKVVA
jgi:hypothetical protein